MNAMASQITCVSIVCSTVCSGTDQRKHQSSASLAFVRGIHRWPVNSLHKEPVTRKMIPFDDVIMQTWRPLCLLIHWYITVLGHWKAQRCLQRQQFLSYFVYRSLCALDPMTSFKMEDKIPWYFAILRLMNAYHMLDSLIYGYSWNGLWISSRYRDLACAKATADLGSL